MFLGLDNAGKTTLLHVLKDDRMGQHFPTTHPSELPKCLCVYWVYTLVFYHSKRRVNHGWNIIYNIWSGWARHRYGERCWDITKWLHLFSSKARRVWKDYFPAVDAIVFLIDVFDRDRFEESRKELDVSLSVYYCNHSNTIATEYCVNKGSL